MTEKINVDKLKEAAKILQDIKNGIGTNDNKIRMEAFFTLNRLNKLIGSFEMAKDRQPPFAVGEYYSFTTYRKDYDADTTFIFKASGTKNGGLRVLEYDIHGNFFGEYVYDTDSDFLKEPKPATTEQIATFKKAKIKNDIDFIIKDGDGDWIEIVENIQDYLQTAEELQEVENNE